MTVHNNTGKVVTLESRTCYAEIPIGDSIQIPEAALQTDPILTVRYFSLKNEETETVEEVHRSLRGRHLDIYNRSTMPVVTVFDARSFDAVTLESGDKNLFFLFCFWKRYTLKRIAVKPVGPKVTYFFSEAEHRSRLRRFCLIELIPALLLTFGAIFATVTMKGDWFGIALSLLCLYHTAEQIYHYISMGRWKVPLPERESQ